MKSLITKKVIIVFTVIIAITGGMIILGLSVGNTRIPTIDNPQEVVYERTDENGDVIYTITKQELYEEMKRNNGINQLLFMIDESFLTDYLDDVTQAEIDEKLQFLKYQTNDQAVIDAYDDETKANFEENFERSMILSGYHDGGEEGYARILIAREKFVMDQIVANDDITENDVATYYINSYFEDIQAIRLRFLNKVDAINVLQAFNLGAVDDQLATYLGYAFIDESLVYGDDDAIVEAQITIDTYYFDVNDNILDDQGDVAYTYASDVYLDDDDNTYTLDENGNLVDDEENIVVENTLIFDTEDDALAHKEANTTYFTVEQNGDVIEIYDLDGVLVYTLEDEVLYDDQDQDVTDSVDLRINKEFKDIEDVQEFTENNTSPLTDEEVLSYYLQMYNYIYGEYRDTLGTDLSVNELIALDNEYFAYNYEDVQAQNASLAKFMFSDISQVNDLVYSSEPKTAGNYAYMVYKLEEGEKVDLKDMVMDIIHESIVIPETVTSDIELPVEGPYGSTITWSSSKPEIIAKDGTVVLPEENSIVQLSYTIKVLGVQDTGTEIIQVPTSGETSDIDPYDETYPSLTDMIDNQALYQEIESLILEDRVYGSNAKSTIDQYLTDARKAANIQVYDYYLAIDYASNYDSDYDYENRGHKENLATIDLGNGETAAITAEAFYQRGLNRNPSLMIFYAAQYREAIYSDHFEVLFGQERNLERNDSEFMEYLTNYIQTIKNEYNQLISNPTYLNLYEQYYGWNFDSFQTYLYTRYRVETEKQLIENLVLSELRMLFIQETFEDINIVDDIYDIVEDNYNNFFSLKAQQILIYFDFDEDGELDDYLEYYEGLTAAEKLEFDGLVSELETLIKDSDDTFTNIVTEYKGAERDDEDWGVFKQHGFILKYESLNPSNQDNVEQSLTYSGEYGVKDQYIEAFTDALIDLYHEYQNPLNEDLDSIQSDLVPTKFGIHLIEAEKGDDFDGISLQITEDDYNNISDALLNDNDMPSLSQVDAYFTYKLYDEYNDIENVSMANKYNVTLPIIPDEVLADLDIFVGEALETLFASTMINYSFLTAIENGVIVSELTQNEFDNDMDDLIAIYYDITIGEITVE